MIQIIHICLTPLSSLFNTHEKGGFPDYVIFVAGISK